jgi:hypothetical protein
VFGCLLFLVLHKRLKVPHMSARTAARLPVDARGGYCTSGVSILAGTSRDEGTQKSRGSAGGELALEGETDLPTKPRELRTAGMGQLTLANTPMPQSLRQLVAESREAAPNAKACKVEQW